MKMRIGSAPDSWGVWFPEDPKQTPWSRFLDEVAEAGYEWIELGPYGYLPTDAPALRRELDARGLKLSGGTIGGALHAPDGYDALAEQVLRVGELVTALDAGFLVLLPAMYRDILSGEYLEQPRLAPDDWKRLVETANALGRLTRDRFGGHLRLLFHSHADSHVEYPEQVARFLADTDADLVGICLDTGHYEYRGGDSVGLMRAHHARIPYLHLKSVDPARRRAVEEGDLPFIHAVEMGTFCEPDRGTVDFPALARLLGELEFDGWGIVEQDMYPCPFDQPLPIARRTRRYLREVGLG